jgi:hypothetical protein
MDKTFAITQWMLSTTPGHAGGVCPFQSPMVGRASILGVLAQAG